MMKMRLMRLKLKKKLQVKTQSLQKGTSIKWACNTRIMEISTSILLFRLKITQGKKNENAIYKRQQKLVAKNNKLECLNFQNIKEMMDF